ncbi:MAG: ABC transporter substrate-binding protein [Candidatus Dormibacter sp.]|uniref:ABC transporter substrate-binding protein n=1 Tax=Candidatus Dormibacter sp. TaxID=2973982 RepID=UPI000DB4776B|nr:MAG: hypothetical protein DLM66_01015 [Candidatus Dormibacteraeota bacterium]
MSKQDLTGDEGYQRFEEFLDEWSRRDFLRGMGAATAFTLFAAGGMELLAACGGGGGGGQQPSQAKKGGHVVEATIADLQYLNPVLYGDTASSTATSMIYDSLYMSDDKGNPAALLAKDLPKISSDQLTYTISLRDAKWTDGKPVIADDVKFTYELMFDPKYDKVNSPRRGDLVDYIQSVSVKDATTVVFQLKKAYSPFTTVHLQYGILPMHVWGSLSAEQINTTDLNGRPTVTNGPFQNAVWQKDQQVTFDKNPNYYRGAPNVDRYVIKVIKSSTDILNQLKTGETDVGPVDPAQGDAARTVDLITLHRFPGLLFLFYLYNLDPAKTPLFQQKEVRQALLYALDRQSMAKAIYFGFATVANTSMPPKSWAYNPDNKPVFNFDRKKAESMLDAAGWKKGPDGIRANGAGLKLKFEMITNAGNKVRENSLVNMQQQWRDIGVDATPKFVDFNKVLVPALRNTRDFQVLMVGFQWSTDPDQSQVWASRNSRAGGYNGMSYKNTQLDTIMDQATTTSDQKKRKDLYFKMQQILAEDQPAPILFFPDNLYGVNKRVVGFNAGPFANQYDGRRIWIKDLSVSDGK